MNDGLKIVFYFSFGSQSIPESSWMRRSKYFCTDFSGVVLQTPKASLFPPETSKYSPYSLLIRIPQQLSDGHHLTHLSPLGLLLGAPTLQGQTANHSFICNTRVNSHNHRPPHTTQPVVFLYKKVLQKDYIQNNKATIIFVQ